MLFVKELRPICVHHHENGFTIHIVKKEMTKYYNKIWPLKTKKLLLQTNMSILVYIRIKTSQTVFKVPSNYLRRMDVQAFFHIIVTELICGLKASKFLAKTNRI